MVIPESISAGIQAVGSIDVMISYMRKGGNNEGEKNQSVAYNTN